MGVMLEVVEPDSQLSNKPAILSLPPEIRMLIWEYVLTNYHIHIRYAKKPRPHWAAPNSGYFYHHVLDRGRPPPLSCEPNLHCEPRNSSGRLTPLWLVCKQLYAETAFLPFCRSNVFSFEDHSVFAHFIGQSRVEQREGIKNLWIIDDVFSATVMMVMEKWLEQAKLSASLYYDMTVYIPSRIKRMEAAANERTVSPLGTWTSLRAGWDLRPERFTVLGLESMWKELVKRVVIQEI